MSHKMESAHQSSHHMVLVYATAFSIYTSVAIVAIRFWIVPQMKIYAWYVTLYPGVSTTFLDLQTEKYRDSEL